MASSLLVLCISSLLLLLLSPSHATIPTISASNRRIVTEEFQLPTPAAGCPESAQEPVTESPPSVPVPPEESAGVPGSLPVAPAATPLASPVGAANAPTSGGLQQNQQQQLENSAGGGQQVQPGAGEEPAAVGAQPAAGVQPIGDDDEGQGQAPAAGVQPAFGQGQLQPQSAAGLQPAAGEQALGFGAQPLVDNTPFDSGSSRMGFSLAAGCVLALVWLAA